MFEAFTETSRVLPVAPMPWVAACLSHPSNCFPEPGQDEAAYKVRTAYEACLRMSTKYRVVDDAVARCERGLSRVAKSEAPPVDELRPLPTPAAPRPPSRPLWERR